MDWAPLFFGTRRVLMGTHDRGVDEIALSVLLFGQRLQHSLPDPLLAPPPKPRIGALPRAEVPGQVSPRRSRSQDPDDGFHHLPIGLRRSRHPTHLGWQQWRELHPLLIAQRVSSLHTSF